MSEICRQSRLLGTDTWTDRGNVAITKAAQDEASDWPIGELCQVEVRCKSDMDRVWQLDITPRRIFEIKNLRPTDPNDPYNK